MSAFVCPEAHGEDIRHNFPLAGALCANGCGVAQSDLRVGPPKNHIHHAGNMVGKDRSKGMHGDIQYWAWEIAEYVHEKNRMGLYIGIVKRIGVHTASRLLAEMRDNPNIKTPAKLFMWKIKNLKQNNESTKNKV